MSRRSAVEAAAVATRRGAVGCWIELGSGGSCRVFWARLGAGGRLDMCASWFGPEDEALDAAWGWASDQSTLPQGSASGRILAQNELALALALKVRRRRTESGV